MGRFPAKDQQAFDALYTEMVQTFEQLQWIKKIHALFYAPDTRLVADEIDDIFNISSEKNFSDGAPSNIDPTAFDAGEEIFRRIFSSGHAEVQALKQAMIEDSLSTWDRPKIQAALKQVAIEILSDKNNSNGYLCTHGWTPQLLDKLGPKRFGDYLSDITAETLPPGMGPWPAQAEAERPFETLGALRHWMTKTVHTLSRKQAGKDYNYQKAEDVCLNVVPLKDQIEKPNTKFGQEAELVGYHLLAYSREVPPQKFFESQISAIRKDAAENGEQSLCGKLLKNIDPNGDKSLDAIYKTLNDDTPKRDLDRIAFLRFVMQDQALIQIYRSQITCPVQDTAGLLSGASGSLNLYSLPPQLSSDPENIAKNVTGETLSCLSMMGKGFEEEVTPFADLKDQMTALTKDPKCKAIINQGYATSVSTEELIKHFRTTKEGANREYIFIRPDRKAYLWLPGAGEPRLFDKVLNAKDIHEDRVLYYFAPADTRGTDFKIPSGYGALDHRPHHNAG